MASTRDKLAFALEMGRRTRATVRQCEALLRLAGTLAGLAAIDEFDLTVAQIRKQERIQMDVIAITAELELPLPLFAGATLKIRVPDGGEVEVPA